MQEKPTEPPSEPAEEIKDDQPESTEPEVSVMFMPSYSKLIVCSLS